MEYGQPGEGHGFLIFIIVVVCIVGMVFLMFGNMIPFTKTWHEKLFDDDSFISGIVSKKAETVISAPPKENDWCKIQEYQPGENVEDPIRNGVIGWDTINDCCVMEMFGFDCALHKTATVRYCYSSNIGGEVKYVTIDGYYGDVAKYKTYVSNLDKKTIPNKPCNSSMYPAALLR